MEELSDKILLTANKLPEINLNKMTMTKVKTPPEELVYDSEGFLLRAACVCVREKAESEILLVSSPRRPGRWVIPGGKVQLEEKPEHCAAREALEEAGVVGELERCLGVFECNKSKHRTRVYVLKVSELLDQYEDGNRRQRAWFSLEDAFQKLYAYKALQCKYLLALRKTSKSDLSLSYTNLENLEKLLGCESSNQFEQEVQQQEPQQSSPKQQIEQPITTPIGSRPESSTVIKLHTVNI